MAERKNGGSEIMETEEIVIIVKENNTNCPWYNNGRCRGTSTSNFFDTLLDPTQCIPVTCPFAYWTDVFLKEGIR